MGKENQFELLDAAIAVTEALDGVEVQALFTRGELAELYLYYGLSTFQITSIENLESFVEWFHHAE